MDLAKLKEPLPQEAVTQHESKKYLSSIKAIYVTERFNEVFGVGKWRTKVEHIATEPKTNEKLGDMVVVKLTFEVPDENIYYEQFGGNNNADLGDAYKGAVTDAITKIGSYLGIGMEVFKGKQTHITKTPKPQITEEEFKSAIKKMVDNGTIKIGTPTATVKNFLEMKYTVSKEYEDRIDKEIETQAFNIK